MKILLVEDNETNRDMLSRRLQRIGHDVEVAVDGAEAVDKALTVNPDLILMDIDLPIMSGLDAVHRIRQAERARVPIIALTAHALNGERERCLAAGCDDYQTKPIDWPALRHAISELGGA
jgi:two-component system, cell cycle response regulator DivK